MQQDFRGRGRGGGQVVSVLTFYSDNSSSNPAETYRFLLKNVSPSTKDLHGINVGLVHS